MKLNKTLFAVADTSDRANIYARRRMWIWASPSERRLHLLRQHM